MSSRPYKYKARFDNVICASVNFEDDFHISKASLDSLKGLMPKDVNLDKNIDLIGASFNAAVVNRFNRNGDGIDTNAAIAFKDYFIHKPTNIEHKKERVVGHIVNSGFSSFGENKILTPENVKGSVEPFNIALAAVVYKTVDKKFADAMIQSNDPKSNFYQKISASWEIGFNEYVIAVGSLDLKNAEIITKANQIAEMKQYLRGFDGPGFLNDGTPVYRLVTGRLYPLGIGFTTNPAAEVQGVVIDNGSMNEEDENGEIEDDEMKNEEENESIEVNSSEIIELIQEKISHTQKSTVNLNKIINMNLTLEEIVSALKTALSEKSEAPKFTEEAVASISLKIADSIKQKNEEMKAEIASAEEAKMKAFAEAEQLKKDLEKNSEILKETTAKLAELENKIAEKAYQELYSARMSTLDAEYDLEDVDRQFLAKEVSALDSSDESFASYKEKIAVLFRHKSKAFKTDQEKAFQEKLEAELAKRLASSQKTPTESTQASSKETIELDTALAKAKVEAPNIPAQNIEPTQASASWLDKISKAFSKENITIKY